MWKEIESSFNKETKKLIMSKKKRDVNGMLRLVLDDDKLHCDGLKAGIWQSIKRVKHVVCNRWGANVHTLASSVSGIIYSITIETKEDSILDCIVSCLTACFRKGNSRHPNLMGAVFGFDRGYGVKGLVSYIVEHNGHIFGTVKRAFFNPFTYDQKCQGKWDKRTFKSKEGAVLVDRMVAPIKNNRDEIVGALCHVFFRNGFKGATLLMSTLPEHKHDEWDRIPRAKTNVDHEKIETFFKPHEYMLKMLSRNALTTYQERLLVRVQNLFHIVTEDQNVWEWFVARMFSQTASAANKYIQLGMRTDHFGNKESWKVVSSYYEKKPVHQSSLDLDEIIPDFNNSDIDIIMNEALSPDLFFDGDCIAWMLDGDNLHKLSTQKEKKKLWKGVQEAFKVASKSNETGIDADKIIHWIKLSDSEKVFYGMDTISKLRNALKKRMPKGHILYNSIKTIQGERTLRCS